MVCNLEDWRWTRKLFFFHKRILGLLPSYLRDYLIPCDNLRTNLTRSSTEKRIKTFLWIILLSILCWGMGMFVRPTKHLVFKFHNIKGVKLLTRLRLDFSHLNEHKFRHNFNYTINPMCSCCKEPETTLHYLLRGNHYSIHWLELFNDVCTLNGSFRKSSKEKRLKILLYGAEDLTSQMNCEMLKCTIKFIKKSDPFSGPLSLS